ncbi:DUF3618 domain-containing protein [soil metagenome]
MTTTDPNDPDQIRADIERTRSSLSTDVDTLAGRVDPRSVAKRGTDRLRDRATSAKDAVMGSASSGQSQVSDRSGDAAGRVSGTASAAPGKAMQHTQGNPLAAGLVAFGLGWLASSILPSTKAEQQAAGRLEQQAQQYKQPVTEHAKAVAQEVGENLRDPAQQAAESMRATAQEGTESVQGQAQQSKETVAGQAQGSAESVRGQAQS